MNPKPATQAAIARELGLSRVTVSHILSGREAGRYNEATRQLVLSAAERLGYRPHRSAQMMRTGRSGLIGVVHFGANNHVSRQYAHFLPQAISEHGYEPMVVDLSWHGQSHRKALEYLLDLRVEGVLIAGLVEAFGTEETELLVSRSVPTVLLAATRGLPFPSVCADSQVAFEGLTHHLHDEGHRDLLLLVNDYECVSTAKRIAGFNAALDTLKGTGVRGHIERLAADRDPFLPGLPAYRYMKGRIAAGRLPDAVLCSDDFWAQAVFTALLEAGLQAPRDIALTGFNNEPFTAHAPYLFTTGDACVGLQCAKAVELLGERIAGVEVPPVQHIFPCELVFRESSLARPLAATP